MRRARWRCSPPSAPSGTARDDPLVYLSLASSGGTVPDQALPGILKLVGDIEPLRQVLGGTRAILNFGAQGNAGLTHALIMVPAETAFWAIIGLGITELYDRLQLERISPDTIALVDRTIDQSITSRDQQPTNDQPAHIHRPRSTTPPTS